MQTFFLILLAVHKKTLNIVKEKLLFPNLILTLRQNMSALPCMVESIST